jgi:hypothetical protein
MASTSGKRVERFNTLPSFPRQLAFSTATW